MANNPVTADSVRVRIQRALSSEVEECKAIARVQIVGQVLRMFTCI